MQRLPKVFYNSLSLTGLVIVVFNIGFIVFLSIVEAFSRRAHPYADLVIWLLLPGLVLFGAVLIIVGIRRDSVRDSCAPGRRHAPDRRHFGTNAACFFGLTGRLRAGMFCPAGQCDIIILQGG